MITNVPNVLFLFFISFVLHVRVWEDAYLWVWWMTDAEDRGASLSSDGLDTGTEIQSRRNIPIRSDRLANIGHWPAKIKHLWLLWWSVFRNVNSRTKKYFHMLIINNKESENLIHWMPQGTSQMDYPHIAPHQMLGQTELWQTHQTFTGVKNTFFLFSTKFNTRSSFSLSELHCVTQVIVRRIQSGNFMEILLLSPELGLSSEWWYYCDPVSDDIISVRLRIQTPAGVWKVLSNNQFCPRSSRSCVSANCH